MGVVGSFQVSENASCVQQNKQPQDPVKLPVTTCLASNRLPWPFDIESGVVKKPHQSILQKEVRRIHSVVQPYASSNTFFYGKMFEKYRSPLAMSKGCAANVKIIGPIDATRV